MSQERVQQGTKRDDGKGLNARVRSRDWFLGVAAVTMVVLGGILIALSVMVLSEQKHLNEVRSNTGERLTNIDRELASICEGAGQLIATHEASKADFTGRLSELLNENLKRASRNDDPVLAMKIAAAISRKARALGIHADPEELATIARGFLRMVDDESLLTQPAGSASDRRSAPAIEAAEELIGYRSFLLPSPFGQPQGDAVAHSAMLKLPKLHTFRPLDSTSKIFGSTQSMAATAAKIDLLNRPEPILSEDYRALLVDGYDIKIDGMDVRNVVFHNCKIAYSGGPLTLDNVYFSNCSFEIAPEGKDFANVALAPFGKVSLVKVNE
jgi:hypothetical protein